MMTASQERRKHPRLQKNIPLKICSEIADFVTETRDLSCSGAFCRINKYVDPMTKLKIHLLLPVRSIGAAKTKRVSCEGVIVRIEAITGSDHYNVAIFFSDIEPRDVTVLSDFLNNAFEEKQESAR